MHALVRLSRSRVLGFGFFPYTDTKDFGSRTLEFIMALKFLPPRSSVSAPWFSCS
jgi:hypothetical protein